MTPTSHRIRNAKGFTLIELMIVVVIIGILAAIAIPRFAGVTRQSKEAEAAPVLRQIYTLQERYKQRHDQFAADFTDLEGGADYDGSKYVYYEFRMQGTATAFQACAVPKDAALGLSTMVVDQTRRQVRIAACAF